MELLFILLATVGSMIYTMFIGYPPLWVGIVYVVIPAVFLLMRLYHDDYI